MREQIALIVSVGVLVVFAAAAEAADPDPADPATLDLETCVARALARAPGLQASAAAIDAAGAAAAEARARRLPTLGVGGIFQYTSEHMKQELSLGPGLPGRSLEFGDGKVAEVNLGLSWPLFTGGALGRTAQAAAAGQRAAQLDDQALRLDLTREVRQAFVTSLGRRARREAAQLAVQRLERHLGNIEGALAAGAATRESRLRVLAHLSQARQRHLQATAAADSADLVLGRLVGIPGRKIQPLGGLDISLLPPGDPATAAVADRPDLAALIEQESRQELLTGAARGRLWPRVSADVRAHYGRPGVDALANDWMSYATAGVTLDWSLWDGGARKRRVQQEAARTRIIAARHEQLAQALATAHATARTRLQSALQQDDQARERVEFQRQILQLVGQRYQNATATETEFLDAQDDLTQAEIERALAQTRVRLAEAAMLWTLGL